MKLQEPTISSVVHYAAVTLDILAYDLEVNSGGGLGTPRPDFVEKTQRGK
jgi:hypothetical protein